MTEGNEVSASDRPHRNDFKTHTPVEGSMIRAHAAKEPEKKSAAATRASKEPPNQCVAHALDSLCDD